MSWVTKESEVINPRRQRVGPTQPRRNWIPSVVARVRAATGILVLSLLGRPRTA
jgi:hypothetical protein